MKPYFQDASCAIYHGDAREILQQVEADVVVTDPPYGIGYSSGWSGELARSIAGDETPELRDWLIEQWSPRPALIFGTWKIPHPRGTRMVLVWDTQGALGMGDLSIPWKPSHQQIYVLGSGFVGRRTSDVLSYHPCQSTALRGRQHPHEKPIALLRELVSKCPDGIVLDPFMGSGTTLRAAKDLGRKSIGIEIEERYCEVAARRLGQEVLPFTEALK